MKKDEKLHNIREKIVKSEFASPWRIKKREMVGYARYQILEVLFASKEPLSVYKLAFKLGRSYESTIKKIKVLVVNEIVCDKLDRMDGERYYTICPVCPIKENCEQKLEFWVKSGMLEPEPLPSEEFFKENEEAEP